MKIFKNNKCYVEAKDLLNFPVPYFIEIPTCSYEDDFIKFESKEEVEYFKNREDIISYNEIANLSLNELNKKADKINEQIQKLELKWLNSGKQERILLRKNKNYQKKLKIYNSLYESLVDYINNKNIIDFRMKNIELVYRTQSIPREEQEVVETNNYAEDGFIENYCLTEGQVLQIRKSKRGQVV